ncbi:MAG: hypothetical protein LBN09_00640 [Clostridioides sp.]|jgi:hypothetical protein|nr:hypothetical protein [Clostridioides sp.]
MKAFKLLILAAITILTIAIATGCKLSVGTVDNLAIRPTYDREEMRLEDGISKLLPLNTSFTFPSNSTEVGKINQVDLNGDGVKEVVAFKKLETIDEGKSNQVGFLVLSKGNEIYSHDDEEMIDGDSIEYANFLDLRNDGKKEIVLTVKTKDKTNMYVYEFDNHKIKKLYDIVPEWVENKDSLTDLQVMAGHMNGDNNLDILLVYLDPKTNKAYANIVNFVDGLTYKKPTVLENVKNISDMYLRYGDVSKQPRKKGVVIDYPIINGSYYATNILYLSTTGQLEKVFNDNEIIKPYYIPIADIDRDGVLEIPTNNVKYKSAVEANVCWYKWSGNSSTKVFVSQIYYNYKYNYKVSIPNKLAGNIIVEEELASGKKQSYTTYKFYYYDSIDSKRKDLFSIIVENKSSLDSKQKQVLGEGGEGFTLDENEHYVYMLTLNNVEELKRLNLNMPMIKEYFSLMYK